MIFIIVETSALYFMLKELKYFDPFHLLCGKLESEKKKELLYLIIYYMWLKPEFEKHHN